MGIVIFLRNYNSAQNGKTKMPILHLQEYMKQIEQFSKLKKEKMTRHRENCLEIVSDEDTEMLQEDSRKGDISYSALKVNVNTSNNNDSKSKSPTNIMLKGNIIKGNLKIRMTKVGGQSMKALTGGDAQNNNNQNKIKHARSIYKIIIKKNLPIFLIK